MAETGPPSLPVHLTKRIRSACDRCHSQKLKCRKLPSNSQCVRCMKRQTSCVFSPANRGFRSNPEIERVAQGGENSVKETSFSELEDSQDSENSSPEAQVRSANGQNIENDSTYTAAMDIRNDELNAFSQFEAWNPEEPPMYDLTDFDMENLDFSLAEGLVQTNAYFSPLPAARGLVSTPPAEPTTSNTPFLTAGIYIQRLSTLSLSLYEHAATIPSLEETLPQECGQDCDFEIDKTFTYTQILLNIMDEVFPRSPSSYPFQDFCNNVSFIDEQTQSKHSVLDPATMLLVLSCYLRLLDIYETLWVWTHICIKRYPQWPMQAKEDKPMSTQVVMVGSFNVESTITAGLAVLQIFLRLSRQLLDRMSVVAGVMGYSDSRGEFVSQTGHAEITETAFKSAEKRTREATQKFNEIRTKLFEMGIL